MARKYRILSNGSKYIAQVRNMFVWVSLTRIGIEWFFQDRYFVKTFCMHETVEDAENAIENHKKVESIRKNRCHTEGFVPVKITKKL